MKKMILSNIMIFFISAPFAFADIYSDSSGTALTTENFATYKPVTLNFCKGTLLNKKANLLVTYDQSSLKSHYDDFITLDKTLSNGDFGFTELSLFKSGSNYLVQARVSWNQKENSETNEFDYYVTKSQQKITVYNFADIVNDSQNKQFNSQQNYSVTMTSPPILEVQKEGETESLYLSLSSPSGLVLDLICSLK
ncbi:MAG: hypothetical protein KDD45_00910 [Bdellovibrionales bacterium]|nr:hypothetical protein [Bdellovibrionales bacterium]